jgi:hypothetical protein
MSLDIRIYGDTVASQVANELRSLGLSPHVHQQSGVIEASCHDIQPVKEITTRHQVACVRVHHGTLIAV